MPRRESNINFFPPATVLLMLLLVLSLGRERNAEADNSMSLEKRRRN